MWNYINGEVKVHPMGRTVEEQEYILKTVLNHLPIVTGSETAMRIDIVKLDNFCSSSSYDELGNRYDKPDLKGEWNRHNWKDCDCDFKLVLTGLLRHTCIDEIYKSFWKWLVRLAKRVNVDWVMVNINDYHTDKMIFHPDGLRCLFEEPTWMSDEKDIEDVEPNWCEYLMWDRDNLSMLPVGYVYKYYNDDDIDEEMLRRLQFHKNSRNRLKNK